MELSTVRVHGHEVAYRTAGEGPVVLLVHGMAGSSSTWKPVIPLLAAHATVVAPDLPGHGRSAKPRGDYSLGASASFLRDLITIPLADQIDAAADSPDSVANLLAGFSSGAPTKLDLLLLEALALASRSDEAKEVLATALDGFVEILMKRINVARERGDIDTSIDTEALRQVFVAWIFGGVVVKALKIGTAPIDSLTDATRRLIGGLAPTA